MLIILLNGCATKLKGVSYDDTLIDEEGYIAGNFYDTGFYFFNFSGKSPYTVKLKNAETGKDYIFNFMTKSIHTIYSIPVGRYRVESVYQTTTTTDSNGATTSHTYYLNVPEDLLFNFNVEPSKVTYLGDIKIKSKGFWIFKSDYTHFNYNLDDAKTSISEKYSYVSEDSIISY